jgi:Na+:H+ antiporter, NhaA family
MNASAILHDDERASRTQLELAGDQLLRPFRRFSQHRAAGGLLLLCATACSLVWANSPWASSYAAMLEQPFGISFGDHLLRFDLRHWINDGFMTVFFFAIGLEIKREIFFGELARLRQAVLPVLAAIGGMLVPAAIYLALNAGGSGSGGWSIPIATDIAFALGALTVLGARVPIGLKVFVVALAIVDDLGAMAVIGLFHTRSIDAEGIAIAGLFLLALVAANLTGLRRGIVYSVLGAGLWYGLLSSGIHATLAGVLMAFCVPMRVKVRPNVLARVVRRGADIIQAQAGDGVGGQMDADRFEAIHLLRFILRIATSPVQRFEHAVQPWVTFAILPTFALFNAGVAIDPSSLRALASPVGLGVGVGLAIGKPLGVLGASWLAVRAGVAVLPEGVSWRDLAGAACLTGIGFTMALFIADLSFAATGAQAAAKLGILIGSLCAAGAGWAVLITPWRVRRADTTGPARGSLTRVKADPSLRPGASLPVRRRRA